MILSRHIATAHLLYNLCRSVFHDGQKHRKPYCKCKYSSLVFVAECQPTVFMFPIIWEVFKKNTVVC